MLPFVIVFLIRCRIFRGQVRPEERPRGRAVGGVLQDVLRIRRRQRWFIRGSTCLLPRPQRRPGARHVSRSNFLHLCGIGKEETHFEDPVGVDRGPEGTRTDI